MFTVSADISVHVFTYFGALFDMSARGVPLAQAKLCVWIALGEPTAAGLESRISQAACKHDLSSASLCPQITSQILDMRNETG